MRPVYATRFYLDDANFDIVRDQITAWATGSLKKRGAEVALSLDGQTTHPLDGHTLRAHDRTIGDGRAFELEWQHPDNRKPDFVWNTRLMLAADGEDIEFGCLVRVGSPEFTVAPIGSISLGAPRIVRMLLADHRCRAATVQIAGRPTQVQDGQIDLLVPFLLDESRALPIVLVSQDAATGEPLRPPAEVQGRLVGLAHVYEITRAASYELTDELGKKSSCFNGAVRVYWPRFKPEEWPRHPLYLPEKVRALTERGPHVEGVLFRLLAGIAASRFNEGAVWRRLRTRANRERQEEIHRLRERAHEAEAGAAVSEEYEEFLSDYEETLAHVEELREENDQLRSENARLNENLVAIAQHTDQPALDETADLAEPEEPTTVEEALKQANTTFDGRLDVWDSATDSAQISASNRAEEVYDALAAIAELVREAIFRKL